MDAERYLGGAGGTGELEKVVFVHFFRRKWQFQGKNRGGIAIFSENLGIFKVISARSKVRKSQKQKVFSEGPKGISYVVRRPKTTIHCTYYNYGLNFSQNHGFGGFPP